MGELFNRFDVEVIQGKDITIGDYFPEIFVSENDEVFCYGGICLSDRERRRQASFMHPYYMIGKHSEDALISDKISAFYRIAEGCIILDNYVDSHLYKERLFKKINAGVRFPQPDSYYAVFADRVEHDGLTRAVFGLTYEELTSLLEAYAKVMGTYSDYFTYPKLTRSVRNENCCDMTDAWIPEKFPYIAFSESGYEFSHVSLWAWYRHIQLLTGCKTDSTFSRALLKYGAAEDILNRVFTIGRSIYYQTKVTSFVRE